LPESPEALTARPRRYGGHATLKAPFRLAPNRSFDDLETACRALAADLEPVTLDALTPLWLGRFLALVPLGDTAALDALAAACVTRLDGFRAPPTPAELDRRRAQRLTVRQEQHLARWGYPYVLDAFRFHMTLTGPVADPHRDAVKETLGAYFAPCLPAPFRIAEIALVSEDRDGFFHLMRRFPLTGG